MPRDGQIDASKIGKYGLLLSDPRIIMLKHASQTRVQEYFQRKRRKKADSKRIKEFFFLTLTNSSASSFCSSLSSGSSSFLNVCLILSLTQFYHQKQDSQKIKFSRLRLTIYKITSFSLCSVKVDNLGAIILLEFLSSLDIFIVEFFRNEIIFFK